MKEFWRGWWLHKNVNVLNETELYPRKWFPWSILCMPMCAQSLQSRPTFCNPWTMALQVPLSMGFSRQEYWSGLRCPPPGRLPDSGIEPASPVSPALWILYWWATGEGQFYVYFTTIFKNWKKKKTKQKRSPFFKSGAFSAIFFRYCECTGWLGHQYLLGKLGNLEAVSRDLWGWVKGMWGACRPPGVRSVDSAWPHLPLPSPEVSEAQLDFNSYPASPWQLPGAFPPLYHCRKTFLEGVCFLPQTNFFKF